MKEDKTRVILGNCMEYMKNIPDNYFQLSIVDPPYGIGVNSINMGSRKTVRPNSKKWDNSIPDINYFNELYRVSKNQIIWGGNYFDHLPIYNPKLKRKKDFIKLNGIIWDKGETMYGRDFSECEIAYSTFNKNGIIKISPNQLNRFHPTQKPVKLYEWLLMNYAKEGDKILDTHLGSGSSRIAAYNLGFDFTGIELDEDYFNDSVKRFNQHKRQLTIF